MWGVRYPERRNIMRIWQVMAFMLIFLFANAANAQYMSMSSDFFMHDRFYETFLRDYMRFNEPKPLRIEYWNINWLDSGEGADEYKDYLHFESLIPIYTGAGLIVDIPFQYRHVPTWAEKGDSSYGGSVNVLKPYLMTRWTLTDRFKAIAGWEYNLKGDSDTFGKSVGREICLLKTYFSYDIHPQLNLIAGSRLDRYYYDPDAESDPFRFEVSRRLYYRPALMLNWHPNKNYAFLLGIPGMGARMGFGNMLKVEARADINKAAQIAINVRPVERVIVILRLINAPYTEIPIEVNKEHLTPAEESYYTGGNVFIPFEEITLTEMLGYTDKSAMFEIGWKLNPAALASVGGRYSFGGNVEIRDATNVDVIENLDGKPNFALGITFTVSIEALLGMR